MKFEVGVNTYIDLEDANEIAEDIFYEGSEQEEAWNKMSDKQKMQVIIKSTNVINKLPYKGRYKELNQDLPFPRYINSKVIECPDDIKYAIMELAIDNELKKSSQEYNLISKGVKSYNIKGASISFGDTGVNAGNQGSTGIREDIYNNYLKNYVY